MYGVYILVNEGSYFYIALYTFVYGTHLYSYLFIFIVYGSLDVVYV